MSRTTPRPSGARTDDFVEQVLALVEAVPRGCVTTYGDLAAMVGRGGPRQVGAVLARHGAAVAWWRVVRADGRPADGLVRRAVPRLVAEGVDVRDVRVRLAGSRWRPGPDELARLVQDEQVRYQELSRLVPNPDTHVRG